MMPDMEKVIAWLADTELFYREHGDSHNSKMACDALELLKEQHNEINILKAMGLKMPEVFNLSDDNPIYKA